MIVILPPICNCAPIEPVVSSPAEPVDGVELELEHAIVPQALARARAMSDTACLDRFIGLPREVGTSESKNTGPAAHWQFLCPLVRSVVVCRFA